MFLIAWALANRKAKIG